MHPASQTALGGCCISGINAGRCVNYTARDGAGKKQGGREIYRLICSCASSRRQRYVGSITTDEGYNGGDAARAVITAEISMAGYAAIIA